MLVVSSGWPEQDQTRGSVLARRRADEFVSTLACTPMKHKDPIGDLGRGTRTSAERSILAIRRAIEFILAGDILQTN